MKGKQQQHTQGWTKGGTKEEGPPLRRRGRSGIRTYAHRHTQLNTTQPLQSISISVVTEEESFFDQRKKRKRKRKKSGGKKNPSAKEIVRRFCGLRRSSAVKLPQQKKRKERDTKNREKKRRKTDRTWEERSGERQREGEREREREGGRERGREREGDYFC